MRPDLTQRQHTATDLDQAEEADSSFNPVRFAQARLQTGPSSDQTPVLRLDLRDPQLLAPGRQVHDLCAPASSSAEPNTSSAS